jgi:hypothetical protein
MGVPPVLIPKNDDGDPGDPDITISSNSKAEKHLMYT